MRSAQRSALLFHPRPRRKSNMLAVKRSRVLCSRRPRSFSARCAHFSTSQVFVYLSWRLICDSRSAAATDTSSLLWKSRMHRPHRAYLLINRPAASCWVVFNLTRVSFYPTWQSDKWHFASCVFLCHWCWRTWRMTTWTTRWGTPASSHLTRRICHVSW